MIGLKKNMHRNYALNEVVPFSDFKEMLDQATKLGGNKPGFKYKSGGALKEVTYGEFTKETQSLGTALASLGVANKHIAIVSGNCYEYLTVFLSVLNSEGVLIPVDKELPFDEIMHIINHSDSEVVFYSSAYSENMLARRAEMPLVKYFIPFDAKEDSGETLSYYKLLEKGSALLSSGERTYLDMKPKQEDMKLIVYTSGTTGTSKGVMLSLHNLVSCVYYGLQISTVYDTCLSVLPYHHTYESVCGLLVSMHMVSTICINESLRTIPGNLKEFSPSYIMLVPLFLESFYKKIWANAEASGKDKALKAMIKMSNGLLKVGIDLRKTLFKSIHEVFGGRMRKIVCGGAPVRAELGEFFESIGITVINGYGITECSPLVAVNRDYFYDWKSVGVKLPCIDVKIDNPNSDGEGEILVKGDTVMLGYYKKPDITAEVLTPDGWFHTGDFGKIDELQRVYITGRKKNLIVLKNGKNIYPEEIEDYVSAMPLVKEVIVSAVQNKQGEELALSAEIFPDEDQVKGLSEEQIYEKVKAEVLEMNANLPKYKHVLKVVIRKEPFIKTTTGKIKRNYTKLS